MSPGSHRFFQKDILRFVRVASSHGVNASDISSQEHGQTVVPQLVPSLLGQRAVWRGDAAHPGEGDILKSEVCCGEQSP